MKNFKIILISLILFTTVSVGQNFNDALRLSAPGLGSDSRALSMGNAFTALGGSIASLYFNPAGLGLINKQMLTGGLNYNIFDSETSFFGNPGNYSSSSSKFNHFGFAYPFAVTRGSLVLGFVFNRRKDFNRSFKFSGFNAGNNSLIQELTSTNSDLAYDLGLSYPIFEAGTDNYLYDTTLVNGGLQQSGLTLQEGFLSDYSIGVSTEMAKGFFVGGQITYIEGQYSSDREYYEDDTHNNYSDSLRLDPSDPLTAGFRSFFLNDLVNLKVTGWKFKVGFIFQLFRTINLGGAITFPVSFTVDDKYTLNGESAFKSITYQMNPVYSDLIGYNIRTPFEFSTGAAVDLRYLVFSSGLRFVDYSQMKFTKGLTSLDRNEKNNQIKDLFGPSYEINLGAEATIPIINISGRIGAIYQSSPFKNDPKEFDKKYITAGLGIFKNSPLAVDLAYAYGWWNDISDNYGAGESRVSHKIVTHNIFVTFSYDMDR